MMLCARIAQGDPAEPKGFGCVSAVYLALACPLCCEADAGLQPLHVEQLQLKGRLSLCVYRKVEDL